MSKGGRGRFLDKRLLADDAPRGRRPVLSDPLPFQRVEHRRERPGITDHAEGHDGVPLDGPILHRLEQGLDRAWIADHPERDRRILAHRTIGVLERLDEGLHHPRLPDPGTAGLIVARHAAQRAGGVAANHKILVLEAVDQRPDGRFPDGDQRRACCLSNRFRAVLEKFDERRDGPGIPDFA